MRGLFVSLACCICGPILIYAALAPLPDLSELRVVSGRVAQPNVIARQRGNERFVDLELYMQGDSTQYLYPSWFPEAETLGGNLERNQPVRLWVDGRRRIWQLESEERVLARYEDVRVAVAENRQLDGFVGVPLLLLGLWGLWRHVAARRRPPRAPAV